MISIPVYAVFLLFLGIIMGLEMNRRKRLSLIARIRELEHSLDMLRKELDELQVLKSNLLSRMGVSLRKPLGVLRKTVEELSGPSDISSEIGALLSKLTSEIREIEGFLGMMNDLAELEEMDLTEAADVDGSGAASTLMLDRLTMEVLDEWNRVFTERGISLALSIDEDIPVHGSRYHLRYALDNILTEIARYMQSGSLLHLTMMKVRDSVRLTVDYRGETRTDSEPSAFGTELARQIVNAHGGWLTSDDENLRYSVELPLGRPVKG